MGTTENRKRYFIVAPDTIDRISIISSALLTPLAAMAPLCPNSGNFCILTAV
jgi:hypothetical protein